MSVSAFHQHFKTITAMSPLQYQKRLRLQEARRLILSASLDAASAGHRVGYDSASQFSREYSRLFGAPPMRDAARLRAPRSEEHTSELQSLMRISYAVFCLKNKTQQTQQTTPAQQ